MPQGPILIFDKSALQSLNVDESVWLDNFYLTNITPVMFVEHLADFEKEMRSGRTAEEVVGSIAYKTPEQQATAHVHHPSILAAELSGNLVIDMERPKPVLGGGKPVVLEGSKGLIFHESPEEEAVRRWQNGEFLEIERNIAKAWRRALSMVDHETFYQSFKKLFTVHQKPKTLEELKVFVDGILTNMDQGWVLGFGMELLGVSAEGQGMVKRRWEAAGKPTLHVFAPYFNYVLSVELFFYLGMAADLISRDRASHKIDIAYLYYLPFCMVFTSNDKLHINTAPLFLMANQTLFKGTDLKADLAKLDEYYSALPEEVRNRGMMSFALNPPPDTTFLTTQLWDKHLPNWRAGAAAPKEISRELQDALLKLVKRFTEESTPLHPSTHIPMAEVAQLTIQRKVSPRKGKWRRVSTGMGAAAKKGPQH